jgi:predicted ABC-type ATPase
MPNRTPKPSLPENPQGKPKLLVIAGPNGAGKTTFTRQLLNHYWSDDCVFINPDLIAENEFGGWNDDVAVMKAATRAAEMREECLHAGKSMVVETVLSKEDKVVFLQKAQDRGFFVRVFFIGTDTPEINAARVVRRMIEGGHNVPINKIIARYFRSMRLCVAAGLIADRLYVHDNSFNGKEPALLFRKHDGEFYKTYPGLKGHWWAKGIFRELRKHQKLSVVSGTG